MNVLNLLKMPLQARGGELSLSDAYGMFLSASPLPDNVTPIASNNSTIPSATRDFPEPAKVRHTR